MTENHDQPNLDDVIEPTEQIHPDHRAHGKTPKHLDDDELEQRVAIEEDEVDADS
ncbi:hypothetical protein [uncultured Jatrophihabitans sp.]|uniref:hypothetical protein n=1 Tax=uncultured Jatrophihabitans sp. TaxID=1610747 RepID=UPI0035CC3EE5